MIARNQNQAAAPVFGASCSRTTTNPPTKERTTMRLRILTTLVIATVAVMGFSVASASADSLGQCNEHSGNVAHSTQQWEQFLAHEGVLGEAESQVFAPAGYNHFDQTVSEWLTKRVMIGNAVKPFSGPDKGCNGHLFGAGTRSYEKGKSMFWVLPKQYKKSTKGSPGNFATHHTKTFSRRIVIEVFGIGMPECGNPIPVEIKVEIWVKARPHHPHHKKPAPETPVPPKTPATETPGCNSTNSGVVAGVGAVQGSCNKVEVKCEGANSCQTKTEVECPSASSGGTATGNSTGGSSTSSTSCEHKPEPPKTCAEKSEVGNYPECHPPTCQEEGNCPKPKTCVEEGLIGEYPNCRERTCQEKGDCPKEKTCTEKGEVGAYPNCRPPTCEEKHSCTCKEKGLAGEYPNCHEPTCEEKHNCKPPPTCAEKGEYGTYPNCEKHEEEVGPPVLTVRTVNDVEVGGTTPSCAEWQLPGGDTGTLTFAPHFGTIAGYGEKAVFSVSGSKEMCVTYEAPHNEVPEGEHDWITITLRDNKTGKLVSEVVKFKIDSSPEEVRPG
jgi:hypothetical protein